MKHKPIKASTEEVKKIKSTYKKMKYTIFFLLLAIIIFYISNLLITTLYLQNIVKKNLGINLGNNYKLTRTSGNYTTTIYYKDGIYNHIYSDNQKSIYAKNEEIYQVDYLTKTYQKIELNSFLQPHVSLSLFNYFYFGEDEESLSFKSLLTTVYQANVKLSSETIHQQKYLTVSLKAFNEKLWIHPDTYYIEKENMDGQITEQKLEKNVVTDEDIKTPWDLGFTRENDFIFE